MRFLGSRQLSGSFDSIYKIYSATPSKYNYHGAHGTIRICPRYNGFFMLKDKCLK